MEKQAVLIVEDEEKTGDYLKEALELEGLEVTRCLDGPTALKEVQLGRFDLIVLDLKMPGMLGDEVLKHIRDIDPYVEVAIFTNYQDPPQMKALINLGVDAFIQKGAEADLWEIVNKVKERLRILTDEERDALFARVPDLFK